MVNRQNQIYEDYWSYTAAYTDLNGEHFLNALKACIEFFDRENIVFYTQEKYEELQRLVGLRTGITPVSVRKAINQLVKLGFIKPYLQGYYPEAKEYANATTDRKRKSLLSKLVYRHGNFNNSVTNPDEGGYGQINFFLKTLEEVGVVDDRALIALMAIDINDYPNGYLKRDELDEIFVETRDSGFIERKYNQISHLKNLLSRLDDLQVHDNAIYFKTDALRLFGDDEETRKEVRDPYLQRVYKSELEQESILHYGSETPKCMLEGLAHPVLIASHIKPYKSSNSEEAFDVNNGLLLSKNTDSLFDLGYMSFDTEGKILPSKVLDSDMVQYLSQFRLIPEFMNTQRMEYMVYHREHVFEKRFSSSNVRRFVFQENSVSIQSIN